MQGLKCFGVRHVVVAADVTATTIKFPTKGPQISGAIVLVKDAAGLPVAWNGATVVSPAAVTIGNTGATDWVATHVIDIVYW